MRFVLAASCDMEPGSGFLLLLGMCLFSALPIPLL